MSGKRSPGYPNFSLREAVKRAEKIFSADRRNPVERENAVRVAALDDLGGHQLHVQAAGGLGARGRACRRPMFRIRFCCEPIAT